MRRCETIGKRSDQMLFYLLYLRVRKVGLPFTEDADLNALESAVVEEQTKRGQKLSFSGFAGTRYIIEIDGKRYESAREAARLTGKSRFDSSVKLKDFKYSNYVLIDDVAFE